MCNAYNLRHRNEAILDIARAMQVAVADLPVFPPQHRIGIKDRGLILRPRRDGPLAWLWALWVLIPPGSKDRPLHPFNNARSDKLGSWPWKGVQRKRKPGRTPGKAPWSYCIREPGEPVRVTAVAIACLLGACSGLGPRTIPADQIDYSNAIGEASKQQVLLNVVKLRFGDLPSFVSVSQLVAGYQLSGNASVAAQVSNVGNLSQQSGNQAAVTLGGTFSDNPTVTYTPLAGVEFADTLLAPLGPEDIVGLVLAGAPIRLTLGVGFHSLGDYHNEIWGTLPNAQADPQFIELVGLIDELTRGGWIALTNTAPADREAKSRLDEKAKDGKRPAYLLFRAGRPEPGLQAKVARVRELLRLDPKRNEFELISGLGPSEDPGKIVFRTRSLIEILGDLAGAVDVPDAAGVEQRGGAVRLFAPEVKVRTSPEPPGAAFVVVRYQGDWYYIANDDLRSRQLFTLCMLLYSLAQSGKPLQLPILTIPTG